MVSSTPVLQYCVGNPNSRNFTNTDTQGWLFRANPYRTGPESYLNEIAGTHRLSYIAKTPLLSANRQDSVFRRHPESTAVFSLLTYSHCLYRNHVQHCAKGNRVNQLSSKNLAQLREPSFL
jgi:hypothetical protein